MPTRSEVVRLNLEYYRKQAKALPRAIKAGDANALERQHLHVPEPSQPPALHDAQLTIAREQGFASWPRFKTFIVESNLNFQELVTAFIDAAVSDGNRAEALLAANPKVADAGFYVALVLGDWKQVERTLTETPILTNAKSGPQNCEPQIKPRSRPGRNCPSPPAPWRRPECILPSRGFAQQSPFLHLRRHRT